MKEFSGEYSVLINNISSWLTNTKNQIMMTLFLKIKKKSKKYEINFPNTFLKADVKFIPTKQDK